MDTQNLIHAFLLCLQTKYRVESLLDLFQDLIYESTPLGGILRYTFLSAKYE